MASSLGTIKVLKRKGVYEGRTRKTVNGKIIYSPRFRDVSKRVVERMITEWHLTDHAAEAEKKALPRGQTVGEYLDKWIARRASRWAETTRQVNLSIFKSYFGDEEFRAIELTKATPQDVYAFLERIKPLRDGNLDSVKANVHKLLKGATKAAVTDKLIPTDFGIISEAPTRPQSRSVAFEPEHEARLTLYADSDPFWSALTKVAFDAGLRTQELLGLRWSDVLWDRGQIRIWNTLDTIHGKPRLKDNTKTPKSRRNISLAQSTLAALSTLYGLGRAHSDHIFHHNGEPYERRQFCREWEALLKRAGVPHYVPYACRHTMATRLLGGDRPQSLTAVSRRLGHNNANVTLGTYAHCLPTDDALLASAYDLRLSTYQNQSKIVPNNPVNGASNGANPENLAA